MNLIGRVDKSMTPPRHEALSVLNMQAAFAAKFSPRHKRSRDCETGRVAGKKDVRPSHKARYLSADTDTKVLNLERS